MWDRAPDMEFHQALPPHSQKLETAGCVTIYIYTHTYILYNELPSVFPENLVDMDSYAAIQGIYSGQYESTKRTPTRVCPPLMVPC